MAGERRSEKIIEDEKKRRDKGRREREKEREALSEGQREISAW